MRRVAFALAGAMALCAWPSAAEDLVYTPINPSFGGNPLNSSHLFGLANAQRDATASDADDGTDPGGGGGGGEDPGETDVDLFIRQLQGRLLSALASQVTEAIFGENPQDSGTITFGDTTVEFERTADAITLRITDGDGTVTVITVPQLVVTDTAGLASGTGVSPASSNALAGSTSLFGAPLSESILKPLN